ncbi:hypothetical protein APY03_3199 [Variovorax sp. WDL1]|nr:hypothetical protein APY03_3199 [Variovorax sp. WDL1]
MVRQHTHARADKGGVDRHRKPRSSQGAFDFAVRQEIRCASQMYSRIFFSDEAACFSFINERSCTYICREGNGGCFSVVEGLARRTDDEILEMDEALLPELYDLDQARIKQRGQLDSVLTTFPHAAFDFVNDHIDNRNAVRQCFEDRLGAAGRIEVDNNACVSDQQ